MEGTLGAGVGLGQGLGKSPGEGFREGVGECFGDAEKRGQRVWTESVWEGSWRECSGDWGNLGGGGDMAWDRVWESVWELGKVGEAGRGSGRGSCVFG